MLQQGSVIRALVPDPQGQNPKWRPLVVLTPTAEIENADTIVAVAITGAYSDPLASDEVPLPYHPQGKARSGLRKPRVAKCSWLVAIPKTNILDVRGFLSHERLSVLLLKVSELTGP